MAASSSALRRETWHVGRFAHAYLVCVRDGYGLLPCSTHDVHPATVRQKFYDLLWILRNRPCGADFADCVAQAKALRWTLTPAQTSPGWVVSSRGPGEGRTKDLLEIV